MTTQTRCPHCSAVIRVPGPGRYKCPKCGSAVDTHGSDAATEVGSPAGTGFSTPAYLQRGTENQSRAERELSPGTPSGARAALPMLIGIGVLVGVMLLAGAIMAALGVFSTEAIDETEEVAPPAAAAPAPAQPAPAPEVPRRDPRMAVVPDQLQTDVIRRVAFELKFMNRSGDEAIAAADKAMQSAEGYIPGSLEVDEQNRQVIFEYRGPELLARQYVDVLTLHSGIETGREPTFLESRVAPGP